MPSVTSPDSTIDAGLMRRVQADDVEAFERLYDRHATRAYRVALSTCGDAHRAEEAVQDAFLKIWRARATFRSQLSSFQAWSMIAVRSAAIDVLRYEGAGKRPRLAEHDPDVVDPQSEPLVDSLVRDDQAAAVRRTLQELPAAQSEVIALAFFGELSHAEIAERLALPPGTVKGRMRLGLEKLRREIEI